MSFGLYVHIPYCLQRCHYCDFATYEWKSILPPQEYLQILLKELTSRRHLIPFKKLKSIYFGGGTPSLVPAEIIVSIIEAIHNEGFHLEPDAEVTLEINPATIDKEKMKLYLSAGVNRFSVGAQSFDDELLKLCGREHNSLDTIKTLELLQTYEINYSFDLLFALPHQTIQQLKLDLDQVCQFRPHHLSAYCLTVPEGHMMSKHRPKESIQVEMFQMIQESLQQIDLHKYEISNFARPGFESKHNQLYWSDSSYWGLGLGAHSYLNDSQWGQRFWNPKSIKDYTQQILTSHSAINQWKELPEYQCEQLKEHEACTDFCHTHLRTMSGLPEALLLEKFSSSFSEQALKRLSSLERRELLQKRGEYWSLTEQGELLSDQVFFELTFAESII